MSLELRLRKLEQATDPAAEDWARQRMTEKAECSEKFDWSRFRRDLVRGFTLHCRPTFDGTTRADVLERATRWLTGANDYTQSTSRRTEAEIAAEAEHETDKQMGMTREQWAECTRESTD